MRVPAKDHEDQVVTFGACQLDLRKGQVWRGKHAVRLTPKAFAALCYFVDHPGQLVTKDALLTAVWPQAVVGEATLASCIKELRRALHDKAKAPRYLETVHGRGYRFLPAVTTQPMQSSEFQVLGSATQDSGLGTRHSLLVGREAELAQLSKCWEKALNGERQIVFMTGEPGIGKTALAGIFLKHVVAASPCWVGKGQCVEQFGAGEPYLPVLQALEGLCREPGRGQQLIAVLHRHAPMWLMQLPASLNDVDLDLLQRKTAGATRQRMLREMAGTLEILTQEQPLVLVLEDVHWSDVSTLELLSYLARRQERARMLVISTYRPVEILGDSHLLKRVTQELFAHALAEELTLRRLHETEVSTYLTLRFPDSVLPTRLGQVLYQRTGGNPLFLTSMVRDLMNQRMICQGEDGRWEFHGNVAELEMWTPESVRHLLVRQQERLSPDDQRVLEAASLAGLEFSAAAVAAALDTTVTQVEDRCGRLAEQQQFLRHAGVSDWPDGTRAARYGFLHALYQEFWHSRVSVGKQQQWHLRMGERKEVGYGKRANEIAAELAVHFAEGRDYRRAVQYFRQAAANATQRSAHQEAIALLSRGLELLKTLPNTPERIQQELGLQAALGQPLIATKGYAAPEVERTYTRARELCEQVGETTQIFPVLFGLWVFYLTQVRMPTAQELAAHLLRLAQGSHDPALLLEAHRAVGSTLHFLGEFASAHEHLEQALTLYNSPQHRSHAFRYGQDPGVVCRTYAARTLWYLGYPEQALQRSAEALTVARESSNPFDLAHALVFAAELHRLRREGQLAKEQAEAAIALCAVQGFPMWLAQGTMLRGIALAEQGHSQDGIPQARQGLSAFLATGKEIARPDFLVLLAGAYGAVRQTKRGLAVLAAAFLAVERTGMRICEAELYRLKGILTLQLLRVESQKSRGEEAEEYFLKATTIAQKQQAKSLELRATVSLTRLWQQQGKQHAAHQMLSEIYSWFTEGFDTKDLQEAKTLLTALA